MCGLAGFIGIKAPGEVEIERTLNLMQNRGPDAYGALTFNEGNQQLVLLHSRLGIIDLYPRANQPFSRGGCTLVFNGEIYNYIELRRDLEKRGCKFQTASDTEVLLHTYLEYGESCVEYFEGMWSFAIYDRRKHRLFLSRDRFGEKPLYYLQTGEGLYFASEVKFLQAFSGQPLTINMHHLYRYLVNGYKSLYKVRETFFQGIGEVPFASNLIVEDSGKMQLQRYWQPAFKPDEQITLTDAVDGVKERLFESIRLRLRADVPLAFCLSGGIDSASLVSIAAKCFGYNVHTFSLVDSDERYNEYDNIRATIDDLCCQNTVIPIPQAHNFERLEKIVAYHDAPIYTISYYIHNFISENIRQHGYKVAVSGTAADELLTGYYDHFNLHLYEMRHHPDYGRYLKEWKAGMGRHVRNPHLQNPELYFHNTAFREHIYLNNDLFAGFLKEEFKEDFFEELYCDSLLRNRMLNELFHEAIPLILHEDDLNSMQYSIENRSPYLDKALFEFAYSVPHTHLIREGFSKYLLREAVKGILNEQVRTDKWKKGFNAAIDSLFDLQSPRCREYILAESPVFDHVKREKIEELMKMPRPLPNSFSKYLFYFLNAKIFLEQQSKVKFGEGTIPLSLNK